jgi:hypothetical protein
MGLSLVNPSQIRAWTQVSWLALGRTMPLICIAALTVSSATRTSRAATGQSWSYDSAGVPAEVVLCWSRSTLYGRASDGTRIAPEPGVLQIRRWVREAIENTWGRYANITAFHPVWDGGWQYCTWEGEPGLMVIGLSTANRTDIGRLKDAPTRVEIDAAMTTRRQFELAAISLFGQALKILPPGTMLDRVPNASEVMLAQTLHGSKYAGNLVGHSGRCAGNVSMMPPGSPLNVVAYPCMSNTAGERWLPGSAGANSTPGLASALTSGWTCMLPFAAPHEAVATGDCSGSNLGKYSFDSFRWKSASELCVAPSSATPGAMLKLANCADAPLWDFEFLSPARLVLHDSNLCVGIESSKVASGASLALFDCADLAKPAVTGVDFSIPSALRLDATLGNFCATVQNGALEVGSSLVAGSCSPDVPQNHFHVSGMLTNSGRCATFNWLAPYGTPFIAQTVECSYSEASATGLLPPRTEWDYYWQL